MSPSRTELHGFGSHLSRPRFAFLHQLTSYKKLILLFAATMYDDLISRLKLNQFPAEVVVESPSDQENSLKSENLASTDPLEHGTMEYILTNFDSNLLQAFGDTVHLGLDVNHSEEGFEYKPVEFPFK